MSVDPEKAKSIFLQAVEKYEPNEWGTFLDEACVGDSDLRGEVEVLLAAHAEAGAFLEHGPGLPDATIDQPLTEKPGTRIGPYKLLEQIGEGGMGVVYLAEQKEPVKRRVALKIIKPGMDTRQVIARFEVERQALAMMNHPNIAKVLDAGQTDSGRPYFVMEIIKGIPITEYCDNHHLTMPQRLSLFTDVCNAIQHAHQKGVIHRDVKPSNVLITLQDGKPIAKVIDFGVSKAVNQQLTEKTLFTAFGQMVGTLQYMSPEQAEMSGLDIDTRSDIYSLGVLIYELMTGTTPLDGKRLRSLGYEEMQRVVREEAPPRPSNRISTLGEQATSVAEHRSVNVKRLREQLSGELDWIVMKALEKDRGRRYETANSLASDIARYLRNDPVEACPPSAAYRLRKFAARNKAIVGTAAAVALLLLAVIAINMALAAWAGRSERLSEQRRSRELPLRTAAVRSRQGEAKQREQAEIERDKAKAAEMQATEQREVAQAAEQQAQSNFQQARGAVDQYLQTVSESELLFRPGMGPLRRQLLESARAFYQTYLDQQTDGEAPQKDTATAQYRLGRILDEQGDRVRARAEYQAVRPGYEQLVAQSPNDHPLRLELADICRRLDDLETAQQQCQAVLEADPDHKVARRALAALHEAAARGLAAREQPAEALRRYAEAEQIRAALTSGDEPIAADLADLAQTHYAIAQLLLRQQQSEDALKKCRSGVATAERARDLDPRTPRWGQLVAAGLRGRARTERALEQTDEALRSYGRAESAWSKVVFEFPAHAEFKAELARTRRALADYQRSLGRTEDAAQTEFRLEQFLRQQPRALPGDHYTLAVIYAQLAQPAADGEAELSKAASASLPGYAEKAVEQLSLAVKRGYRGEPGLDEDPLFQPLAGLDDFRSVLAESRKEAPAPLGGPASALSADFPHHLLMIASLRGIAAAHQKLGQLDAARTTLDQCLTEVDQLPAGDAATGNSAIAERGKTTYALGHLHWESRHYHEAKRAWERGFALLVQAHDQAGDESKKELARAIATEEWQLIIVFGEIAFWDEAAKHRAKYLKFGPYVKAFTECEIALITLIANEGEHYEDACRYLLDRFDESNENFPYIFAQREQAVLAPDKLVELAKQHASSATASRFSKSILGVCQLRNGNPQEAILNLEFWLPFHRAQALFQIGDHAAARFWLELGERQYADSSRLWLGSPTLKSPEAHFWNWWEQAVLQASREEAWQLIEGRSAPDPWARLFEARGYALVEDAAKSEAAFAEALDATPEDPQVWLASAETRAVLGQHDEAQELFTKALELAPENPESWIARGKYYLERGLDAQADADMMRAAELAIDDLDIFIRSGWWGVGPYPADISKSFPPEDSPHPSRPVARAGDGSRNNLTPRLWIRVPVDGGAHRVAHQKLLGRVHFDGHLTDSAKNASVYTLAYVYSPDDRTATLCFGAGYRWADNSPQSRARMRIWLNGETVLDWTQCPRMHVALQRAPVQLKAGRNEILVRISSPEGHNFRLRLGDSPVAQTLLAARLGQWQRAVDEFQRIPPAELVQGGYNLLNVYSASLAAVNDTQKYEEAIANAFAYGAHTNDRAVLAPLLHAGTLRPNRTMSRAVLLKLVEDLEETTTSAVQMSKGRALLRVQEHQQAINWYNRHKLLRSVATQSGMAMAHHELGKETEAKEWLQKAKELFFSQMADRGTGNYSKHALLAEAHQRIAGVPLSQDPSWLSLRKEIDTQLAQMPPETADYDLALLVERKLPRLWVARARRYAGLSRWEDAERDFAKALSLDQNNPRTWLASARYWAQRDSAKKAHDAYDQVLRLDRGLNLRSEVVTELKDNEPLFLTLLETRDRDAALWTARGSQLCEEKRWADAARVWQHRRKLGEPDPALMYQLALLQIAAGDTSGYANTCGAVVDRYVQDKIDSTSYLAAWACILAPGGCDDYTLVLDLAERCRDRYLFDSSHRVTLGAALLRAGRCEEAIAELEEGGQLAADDDNPLASPPAYAWYLLAMAHSQLGNQDAARQWYEKAQSWTRGQRESQSTRVTRWNRQLTLELLERESADRLGQDAAPSAPTGTG